MQKGTDGPFLHLQTSFYRKNLLQLSNLTTNRFFRSTKKVVLLRALY